MGVPYEGLAACRVVSEYRIRRRTRLKAKAARAIHEELAAVYGSPDGASVALWDDQAIVETGEVPGMEVVLVNQVIHGLRPEGGSWFLSLRGLLAYRPATRWVTVDMGAVRFVINGADIMAPGITEADAGLQEGDLAWVRDEKNGQPLAVATCLQSGPAMAEGTSGKALRSVHFIGDKLWALDEA